MEFPVNEKFSSPEEEIQYLRGQIAEKERAMAEIGYPVSKEAATSAHIEEYRRALSESVLPPERILTAEQVDDIILDLPPEKDDAIMGELLGVMRDKGLKNALTVADRMDSPHIADDFHRVLVQYIHAGYPVPGVKENEPVWRELNMTLYEVTLPSVNQDEDAASAKRKTIKELVSVMEQFYSGLFGTGSRENDTGEVFVFEVAVSSASQEIVFYVSVPTTKAELFEKQLLSLFPHAHLREEKGDYNVFVENGVTLASNARIAELPIYPIKTYDEFDVDPLSVLLNAFSKIEKEGAGASIQFVVRPGRDDYLGRYLRIEKRIEKGEKPKVVYREIESSLLGSAAFAIGGALKGALLSPKPAEAKDMPEEKIVDKVALEAVRKKRESFIVPVNVRIVVSATDQVRAEGILRDIESSFHQFHHADGNRFEFVRATGGALRALLTRFTFRDFGASESFPFSLRELATVLHFPTGVVKSSPEFRQSKSADAPPPLGLSATGTLLGINSFRNAETKAYLAPEDRLRHFYVIGQTGTGKTTLLKNMIIQDIEEGAGVCFIDPHGSDVQDILAAIPAERAEDVIYFDPAYMERVMGLNMLEYDPRFPEQKTFVVNELFSIFKKLYAGSPESMGPAFEQYFRNATLLVLEHPESGMTLLDVSRVLADAKYRALKLSHCKNPVVLQFWQEIATKAQGEASLANIVPYITNKFDVFTANEYMRPIIAQEKSAFNFREVMDSKKILLVNLSKGRLGDINANLLGLILVGKILMAALSRVDAFGSGKEMPPFYLYIDEFQNVTTDSISTILSEARKYKLGLTVAHQFIAQLQEGIRDSIFGNVGSMAVFRVGAEDAKFFEPQFEPTFAASDIMNIDNRNAYLKILAEGKPAKPFNIRTMAPKAGNPENAEALKQLSYLKYGKARSLVEEDILARYRKEPLSPVAPAKTV